MDTKQDLLKDGVGSIVDVVTANIPEQFSGNEHEGECCLMASRCAELATTAPGRVVLRYLAIAIMNQDFRRSHQLFSVTPAGVIVTETICSESARNRLARDIGC